MVNKDEYISIAIQFDLINFRMTSSDAFLPNVLLRLLGY